MTLLIIEKGNPYSFFGVAAMLGTGGYIWRQRKRRLDRLGERPVTITEELEHALANAEYLVRFARTFAYWFLLPIGSVTVVRMLNKGVSTERWLLILGAFALSILLVRWELYHRHLPRKRELEDLRDALSEEVPKE